MNVKELIFGGGVKTAGGGAWRGSIQAWLPINNIVGWVVFTRDNRFIKILEVLPVNIYLKSANDRQNIIASYAAWLKIAPDNLQLEARTLPADTADYVERMKQYAEQEENESCREMIEDNIAQIGEGVASDAIRHRFFLIFQSIPHRQFQITIGFRSTTVAEYQNRPLYQISISETLTDIHKIPVKQTSHRILFYEIKNLSLLFGILFIPHTKTKKSGKYFGVPPRFLSRFLIKSNNFVYAHKLHD